ncbi:MAG: DUF5671 domain-containing protein [bacterium]|nr:DUF5671 domain-containing protein [bacterium]MDZ4284227.1 DUF5671 domain-containing protein [Patescibacteria group bacterium]
MKHRTSPKDFFLYLAALVALYTVVVSVLRLWFEIINTIFPDPLEYHYGFADGTLRAAMAALIVVFPLHLYLARLWNALMRREPEKSELWVRRWFVYLTLFVAGVTLAVDLIVLIDRFLGGELTTRFVFKVIAVFIAAGAVFGYFLYDLRRDVARPDRRLKLFAVAASSVVLGSIIGGFLVIGSPKEARDRRFDDQRTSNLQEIQWQVIEHWRQRRSLPPDLAALTEIFGYVQPLDPATTRPPYEYRVTGPNSFELCAMFSLPSGSASPKGAPYARYPAAPEPASIYVDRVDEKFFVKGSSWEHEAGRACFERVIEIVEKAETDVKKR